MSATKVPVPLLPGSHCTYFSSLHLTSTIVTGIALLINRIWHRTRDRIRGSRSGGVSLRTSTACKPPATRLPQEIVEMIITHHIFDTSSLQACSLTCRSWYIAAVPRLHRTLVTPVYAGNIDERHWWSDSFRCMHKLGLLPLVKKFQVPGLEWERAGPGTFLTKRFDRRILRQFVSLVNVQVLGIDFLDIPSFMPKIQRYFGHFAPTVRSLALRDPKGSRRQITFFIGLFQHLEDLKLLYGWVDFQEEPADDLTLVPAFIPPLRGRLTMTCFTRVGILEDMIGLFGGIRFRYMDLFCVEGMRLLLGACAETLETLRLYPHDPHSEKFSLKTREFQLRSSQSNPPLRTLICRGTNRFGHSRSLRSTPLGLHHQSSTIRSRPLHPLYSPILSSFIGTMTSGA